MTWIEYDEYLIDEIATAMDLRKPNAIALGAIAESIEDGDGGEVVCDLATGVGKTYLAAGLIEYLARNGVRTVLFVTPGTTIYEKTIANFTPGSAKFVKGGTVEPLLITADNFARGQVGDALHDAAQLKLFVFNVQQLIKPTANTSRKVRADDEFIGDSLYDHLRAAEDLVIIADEHHVYRSSATAFSAAIRDLSPRALVGLTATPDSADLDKVIYRYSLAEADSCCRLSAGRPEGHRDTTRRRRSPSRAPRARLVRVCRSARPRTRDSGSLRRLPDDRRRWSRRRQTRPTPS